MINKDCKNCCHHEIYNGDDNCTVEEDDCLSLISDTRMAQNCEDFEESYGAESRRIANQQPANLLGD